MLAIAMAACEWFAPDEVPLEETCTNPVVWSSPSGPGTFYREEVVFTLQSEDPDARIVVTGPGGFEVPGSTTLDGATMTWRWDEPLQPFTRYTAELQWTCGVERMRFTTSGVGDPLEAEVAGDLYELDLNSGDWLLLAFVDPGHTLRLRMADPAVGFRANTAFDEGLERCPEPASFVTDEWEDPWFAASARDPLTILVSGTPALLEGPWLSGAFSADGERFEGGRLVGLLHTEDLGPVFDLGDAPEAVCDFTSLFGVDCVACPTGGECLPLDVPGIRGSRIEVPEPGPPADIGADPLCPTGLR
jgi:hypothetical protein